MAFAIHLKSGEMSRGSLHEMMERLLREGQTDSGGWSPAVDIYETPESVVLVLELAGVNPDNVEITVDRDSVHVSGHRGPTCCAAGARYHLMEITSGGFERSFRIRVPFVAQKVQARADNGLLMITLPKDRLPQARTIIVESE